MTPRDYKNPPVHEVILDLQFEDEVDDAVLEALPTKVSEALGPATRLSSFSFEGGFSPSGATPFQAQVRATGWEFRRDEPTWIVRAQPQRLTLHAVRSENWPSGDYVGWEKVAAEFGSVQMAVASVYGELTIRRAGLRYINRIAVAAGEDLEELFHLIPPTPPAVQGLYAFTTHQAWAEVDDHPGYSASMRFGRIAMPDGVPEPEGIGLLLDIDVFNLYLPHAPSWDTCQKWFNEAHEVENALFESTVRDRLRDTFEERRSV